MTEKKKAGRPYKYPFNTLGIGDEYFHAAKEGEKIVTLRRNIQVMARRYSKSHPANFDLKSEETGVRILRVS